MNKYQNKQISFLTIIFSFLMLIYGFLKNRSIDGHPDPGIEWLYVYIFGIEFNYANYLLFFTATLFLGIYLFVFKNDQSIKDIFQKPKLFIQRKIKKSKNINKPRFLKDIKNKYSEFESSNLPKKEIKKTELPDEDRTTSIVGMITIVAVIFTFYMAIKVGFSMWFFIIYAYYHYLTLTPKSKKEITIKSIFYPMIFLFIFSIMEKGSGETIMGIEFERPLSYYLSKHFIFFVIGVIIMFFSLRKQLGNKPKFSIKNPLFWVSLICFLISIFRFGVIKYMESN